MHELAATESLLKTALTAAEEGKAVKILKIRVGIGRYSGILSEYVEKYYEIAAKGTIAEGAKLIFDYLPVRIRCSVCGGENECTPAGSGNDLPESISCPVCGSREVRLLPDNWDLYVESIEVE